jgi:hypothetical protein
VYEHGPQLLRSKGQTAQPQTSVDIFEICLRQTRTAPRFALEMYLQKAHLLIRPERHDALR